MHLPLNLAATALSTALLSSTNISPAPSPTPSVVILPTSLITVALPTATMDTNEAYPASGFEFDPRPAETAAPMGFDGIEMAGFFQCPYIDWTGSCFNYMIPLDCCMTVPEDEVSTPGSAGPDWGIECWIYSGFACSGEQSGPISFPGFADIREAGYPREWMSWICSRSRGGWDKD